MEWQRTLLALRLHRNGALQLENSQIWKFSSWEFDFEMTEASIGSNSIGNVQIIKSEVESSQNVVFLKIVFNSQQLFSVDFVRFWMNNNSLIGIFFDYFRWSCVEDLTEWNRALNWEEFTRNRRWGDLSTWKIPYLASFKLKKSFAG